jgi:hypothetical protein
MNVHFMCVYYSQWAHKNLSERSQDQWYAFKFCRAVKKRLINGTTQIPLKTGAVTIRLDNVGLARHYFGLFIKRTLDSASLRSPILVPVPSKDGLLNVDTFRSLEMLRESVQGHGNWPIEPVLRFTQPLQPASAGGPRGRRVLFPYLKVKDNPPAGDIVLIDDLITTGGSILASYDRLNEIGRPPVLAIACGYTVSDSLISAFGNHIKAVDVSQQSLSL